jgi:imidazolonepropionase-like amidohydrolase
LHVHVLATQLNLNTQGVLPNALVMYRALPIMKAMLRRGFTTVRDAAGADWGIKSAVEEGSVIGPRLFISGRALSQTGGHGDPRPRSDHLRPWNTCSCCFRAGEISRVADGVDEVIRAARQELQMGADQIKIMASGGVSSPADPIDYVQYSTAEIEAAVDEARRAHKYVMAHAYTADAISRAVELGVRTIEHGNFLDESAARIMATHGAYLVPTLIVYRRIVVHGKEVGVSDLHIEKARQVLAVGTRSLEIARRAGVKMAFGTDLFRAPKQYQAEEFLVRAEVLSPAEIIRSATVIGAEVVRMDGRLGRVAEGHLADLLVVDGDPLSDLGLLQDQGKHMALIMKDGVTVKDGLGLA